MASLFKNPCPNHFFLSFKMRNILLEMAQLLLRGEKASILGQFLELSDTDEYQKNWF